MSARSFQAGLGVLAAMSCAAAALWAQEGAYVPGGGMYPGGAMPYYGMGGFGMGFNNWGAGSTPIGSIYTGMSNVIRSEGEYNLMSSAAAINLEEAQKRDIENRTRWTNAYFEMRRVNEAYRHPKKPPTPPETWVRLAHDAAPNRLTSSQLDEVTGRIDWPVALQSPDFAKDREQLQALYSHRASSGGAIGLNTHAEIRKIARDAQAKLKDRIRQIDTKNYLDARKFLESLAYEADFPAAG